MMGNLCTKISHIVLITSDACACVTNVSIIGGLRYAYYIASYITILCTLKIVPSGIFYCIMMHIIRI